MAMAKRYKTKYKSKRLGAADKALHKARMGDRPHLRRGLATVLNWYKDMYEGDATKAYDACMQYLVDSGAQKTIATWTNNKSTIVKYLTSYHWAIADLLNSGESLEKDVVNRFRARIREVTAVKTDLEPFIPVIKQLTDEDRANKVIAILETEWDSCMNLIRGKLRPKFDYAAFAADQNITPAQQEYIKAFYKQQHQEFVDAYKDRIEGYETFSKGQLKVMVDIMTDICTLELNGLKTPPPTPKKSYYKPKGTRKVTKVKGQRGKKAPPPAFQDKTAVVLFFPQQKQVAVLHAENGKKLDVKRKTINNVDLNKSYVKRFGKQRDMVTNLKRSKFDKVALFIATVGSAKLPATTRLRDGAIVISMKD